MAAGAAEEKITRILRNELEKVDKECVRPLQVRAFRCCASCAEDQSSSAEVVGKCVQSCMRPVVEADKLAQQEVQMLQDRLSRCAQQCQDQSRDLLPTVGTPTIDQESKAKKCLEECLVKCCDTHEHLIPKLISKLRASTGKC